MSSLNRPVGAVSGPVSGITRRAYEPATGTWVPAPKPQTPAPALSSSEVSYLLEGVESPVRLERLSGWKLA